MTQAMPFAKCLFVLILTNVGMHSLAFGQSVSPLSGKSLPELDADEGKAAKAAVEMVLSKSPLAPVLDESFTERFFNDFLRSCDPEKLYFLQSDVDQFASEKQTFQDKIRSGDVMFPNAVFRRMHQRAIQCFRQVDDWINADHDYSIDESLEVSHVRDWARKDAELNDRWRRFVKRELLMLQINGCSVADSQAHVRRRFSRIRALLEQTAQQEFREMYVLSLVRSLDSKAIYLSEASAAKFNVRFPGRSAGIGVRLTEGFGEVVIDKILHDPSAVVEGRISQRDKLWAIAESPFTEFKEVWPLKLDEIHSLTRGKRGTEVVVKVLQSDGAVGLCKLKRQPIPDSTPSVSGLLIDSSAWIGDSNTRIGVLTVPNLFRDFMREAEGEVFESTARTVKTRLTEWADEGIDVVVLDLRGNQGTAFAEALELAGCFVGKQPLMKVKEGDGQVTTYESEALQDQEILWRAPVIVMCDRKTSGSAEFVCAAIQDYQRGLVVGDSNTEGRGTLEGFCELRSSMSPFSSQQGMVKCTTSELFRVTGQSVLATGVRSTIVLPSMNEPVAFAHAAPIQILSLSTVEPAEFTPFDEYVSDEIVKVLAENSLQRVQKISHFRDVERLQSRLVEQARLTTVSLNRAKAEADEQARKALREEIDEASHVDCRDCFPGTTYDLEVLRIAADYVQMMRSR